MAKSKKSKPRTSRNKKTLKHSHNGYNIQSVIKTILGILTIAYLYYLVQYLNLLKSKKCSCATKKPVYKELKNNVKSVIYSLLGLFTVSLFIIFSNNLQMLLMMYPLLGFLLLLFSVTLSIYVIYVNIQVIMYINNLKNNSCKCSESNTREFIFYYSIIDTIFRSLNILVAITMILYSINIAFFATK